MKTQRKHTQVFQHIIKQCIMNVIISLRTITQFALYRSQANQQNTLIKEVFELFECNGPILPYEVLFGREHKYPPQETIMFESVSQ